MKSERTYEVGILVGTHLHLLMMKCVEVEIRNDILIFWADEEKSLYRALIKQWCFFRRVEEADFMRPIMITQEFVKNQIEHVKKKPPGKLGVHRG